MITKITHITLFVANQDEALKFYTEKLGFKVHTDAPFSGFRWLTINLPSQSDFEIALMPANSAEEKALIGKQSGSYPVISLESNDCMKDYENLLKLGVTFIEKPAQQPWGMSAVFKDLYGNLIYLCQTK